MDNDEKTAPSGDDTLPSNSDESSLKNRQDIKEAAPKDGNAGMKSAKTVPFPGPKIEHPPLSLDDSFGMPDFGFFNDPPPRQPQPAKAAEPIKEAQSHNDAGSAPAKPEEQDEAAAMATAASLDASEPVLPLKEGTGWETVGSIMKSSSLRARIEAQDVDDDVIDELFASDEETAEAPAAEKPVAAARSETANVTPFPGPAVQRHAERAPSEMLRGSASGSGKSAEVFDDISARAGDEQVFPPVGEPPANPDALADAVQSALRNIYGSYAEAAEDRPDLSGFTVADALAGAENAPEEPAWAEERPLSEDWQERNAPRGRDYDAPERVEAADSEPVLDYFYAQQRRQERPVPQLSPEMSLNDYAARTAREEKWRDEEPEEEETQRVMPFPGRDRSQPAFRARGSDLSTAGETPMGRGGMFREDTVRPALEPEWGQPQYGGATPQNARGTITPTYAPAVATTADPLTGPQGPDSGHLLGAAGLGLIGGIALAGVLAVFVFNSFVDESGQIGQDGPKIVDRIVEPAQITGNPLAGRSAPESRSAEAPASTQSAPAPAPEQAAPPAPAEPVRQAALSPAPQAQDTSKPKLSAAPVSGAPDSPIKLNIAVGDVEVADALISLKGLPKDARLSTGIDVGGGQWLLPPGRLKDLTVTAPASAVGNHTLEAQLLKDDAQTSISDPIPFALTIGSSQRYASNQSGAGAAPVPQKADSTRVAVLPDEAPLPETDFLTQMLIRDGNKKMREGDIAAARRLYEQAAASGNAEAALAMGRSYDPTYFEKLNVKTGKPDPATAFEWYKKALDGGLVTAKVKIDALKQWLQR
jgi:hypothetical protein